MSFSTLENQIATDWNWLRSFIARNQTISIGAAIIVAWLAGHLRWPF